MVIKELIGAVLTGSLPNLPASSVCSGLSLGLCVGQALAMTELKSDLRGKGLFWHSVTHLVREIIKS